MEDTATQSGIIEVTLPRSAYARSFVQRLPWLLLVALACTCAIFVVIFAVVSVFMAMPDTLALAALVVFPLLVSLIVLQVRGAELREWLSTFKERVAKEDLVQALTRDVQQESARVTRLASAEACRMLVQEGFVDVLIRIGPPDPPAVAPLVQPFEARRLTNGDASLRALAQAADALDPADGRIDPARGSRRATPSWRIGLLIMAVSLGANLVSILLRALAGGRMIDDHGVIGMGLVLIALALAALVLGPLTPSWFIVPGGVLVRRTRLYGATDLRLYGRRASLLIAVPFDAAWKVSIADAQGVASRSLSSNELDILLRAWLSPFAPPALETLSDLR